MNIYYWCPFLSKVATIQAVLNSAESLKKYSKNKLNTHIINTVGEWYQFKNTIKKRNINLINFVDSDKLYKSLPRFSYFKSRLSYLVIFFHSFWKLYSFLRQRDKDDYFVIHLISSLPLMLILFFKFDCKFVLRISGLPKLNFFRKTLWKMCSNKISLVLCPTNDTKNNLISNKIFNKSIHHVLYDPVLEVRKFCKLKNEEVSKDILEKDYIINIGRLTNQKNQKFLIKGFKEILNLYPNLNLVILGDGELKCKLQNYAKKLNVSEKIFFLGHVDNVFKYLKRAKVFILTSKWEDPGFVLIEAAFMRTSILSANCPNGPVEILSDNSGYLFQSEDIYSFLEQFKKFYADNENSKYEQKLKALKFSKKFTGFYHYKNFDKIINKI